MDMKKVAPKIIERDDQQCQVCGHRAIDIHHIVFKSHGGTNDERNLILLCRACHKKAHDDESAWRRKLIDYQKSRYGAFDETVLKHRNKWEVSHDNR